jgi:hypothetical protein
MQQIQRFFKGWILTYQQQGCLGKVIFTGFSLVFLFVLCGIPIALLSPTNPTPESSQLTPMDIPNVQTVAVETAIAKINQTATADAPTNIPELELPTETAVPTAILSPEEALLQFTKDRFKDSLIDFRTSDVFGLKYVTIDYDLGFSWNEETAINAANIEFVMFARRVFEFEGFDVLELKFFTMFTDVYGNEKQEVALKYTITRELSNKINWSGIAWRRVGVILNLEGDGSGVYVHPSLESAWREYVSE